MLAIVSGASRGTGAACAVELTKDGYDVVICCKSSRKEAEGVAAKGKALGRRAFIKFV